MMNENAQILKEVNCNKGKAFFKSPTYWGMLAIALGMFFSGYFIREGMINFKKGERIVVVKGISEREVKSDLAVWSLEFKNSGDELTLLNNKMTEDRKIMMSFLRNLGFEDEEIKSGKIEVIDKAAREYGDRSDIMSRYIIKENFIIRTNKIDLITKALSEITLVIEKGVIISGAPAFYYTKFFDLRPEMLAEATQSARKAALQFSNDSNSKIGNIKSAIQGLFTISPKDSFGENTFSDEHSSIEKRIRVVSTITFNLE
jgi:hypothetical protein